MITSNFDVFLIIISYLNAIDKWKLKQTNKRINKILSKKPHFINENINEYIKIAINDYSTIKMHSITNSYESEHHLINYDMFFNKKYTPLIFAIKNDDFKLFNKLIKHGANVDFGYRFYYY